MNSTGPITLAAAAIVLLPSSAAVAQRQAPTPEQRIERLERQINEMQRLVYPKGRPADTAGFSDEPAATQSSVATLDQRLDAVEREMTDLLRQSEENGHRLQTLQSDLATLRSSEDQRISALEQRMSEAPVATPSEPAVGGPAPTKPVPSKPATVKPAPAKPGTKSSTGAKADTTADASAGAPVQAAPVTDAGEDAYTQGFKLWEAGNYDQAISSLRAFTSAYPKHRRVSYANNLIGRSLLSKGQARPAAEAFLANYRGNPAGERAADSLFYLGQALMQLGQPGQACKAYQELDAVYGAKVRADLRKQVNDAKAQAQCS